MSTAPAVHPPTSSIDQASSTKTIARARRDDTDYDPVIKLPGGRYRIAPAYTDLPFAKRAYALEAAKQGIPESGKRLSNCLLCGAVYARTKFNRKLALAHKFPCSELCCENCGKAFYRHRSWMRKRDSERIYHSKQLGIELGITGHGVWLLDREELYAMTKKLLHWLGIEDAVLLDQAPEIWTRLRTILRTDRLSQDCPTIRAKWREIAGPNSNISFKHPEGVTGKHARDIFLWGFEGMECLPFWSVEDQVAFRKSVVGLPLVRTLGTYYHCLTDEEVAARHEIEQRELMESMERAGWIMEYIPLNERIIEPVTNIDDGYERVEYRIVYGERSVYPHTYAAASGRASP